MTDEPAPVDVKALTFDTRPLARWRPPDVFIVAKWNGRRWLKLGGGTTGEFQAIRHHEARAEKRLVEIARKMNALRDEAETILGELPRVDHDQEGRPIPPVRKGRR